MARPKYQGAARASGFRPVNMQNNAPQRILQEGQRIADGMRTQRDAIIKDRENYGRALDKNYEIESTQRDANFAISQGNIQAQGTIAVEKANQQIALYDSIANLSATAAKAVYDTKKAYDKNQKEADMREFFMNADYRNKLLARHDAMMLDNSAAVAEANANAVATEAGGLARPVETARVLDVFEGLSPGQKAAIVQYKTTQFGSYVEGELNSERTFTDPTTGGTFTGAEARTNGRLFGIASGELVSSFNKENGFDQLSNEFMAPGLETMRKTLETLQGKVDKVETEMSKSNAQLNVRQSILQATDPITAKSIVESSKARLAWAYDGDYVKATRGILEMVYAVDSEGNYIMRPDVRQAILSSAWGRNGEALGSYKALNAEQKNKARKARLTAERENGKIEKLEADSLWDRTSDDVVSILGKGDIATDMQTFNTWEAKFAEQFPTLAAQGYLPPEYKAVKEVVLNENKEEEAELVQQAELGFIDLTFEQARSIVDPTLRKSALELVRGNETEQYGGNYEDLQKSLKGYAKQLTGTDLASDGMSPMGQLLLPQLNKDYKTYYDQELGKLSKGGKLELTDADYLAAQQKALERLQQDVTEGMVNGKGKYARKGDTNNNLYEFPGLNLGQTAKQVRQRYTNTLKAFNSRGDKIFDSRGIVLSDAQLNGINETWERTGVLDVPPVVLKLAEISGELPVDIINRQIEASDLDIETLKPPEAYYELKGQNPEVVAAFHVATTPLQRARAVAQLPSQLQHRGDVTDFEYFANSVAGVESTSYGGYNAYNQGGSNNGFTAHGSGNSSDGKMFGKPIVQMTIGEIRTLQNNGRLFATGRYQFIPSTFSEVASRLNISDDTVFSPDVQDAFFVSRLVQRAQMGMPLSEGLWLEWRGLKYIKDDNPAEYQRLVDTARRLIEAQTGKTYN